MLLKLLLGLAIASSVAVGGAEDSERWERTVDAAALDSQRKAMHSLEKELRKSKSKEEVASLHGRMAEMQHEAAAILFRIANGDAGAGGRQPDLREYKGALRSAVSHWTDSLRPGPTEARTFLARAFLMRGKAQAELGARELAARDFRTVMERFSGTPESESAIMALAEFRVEAKDQEGAITLLRKIERSKDSPHYPFALYRMAWAHYNLKRTEAAVAYLARNIQYYERRDGKLKPSDQALRETSLQDFPLFYLQAYEKKLPGFGIENAYTSFQDVSGDKTFGALSVRFAKLLRAHGHVEDLSRWAAIVAAQEPLRPETEQVLVLSLEDQVNKRQYGRVLANLEFLIERGSRSPEVQKFALKAANSLQSYIQKNKDVPEIRKLAPSLIGLYDAFSRLTGSKDPRLLGMRYNLAETLFTIQDFEGACQHYRWVAERKGSTKEFEQARIKAIAARYEVMKTRQLVPTKLDARAVDQKESGELDPDIAEWIEWIDSYLASKGFDDTGESFHFEANRTLYSQGQPMRALERMRTFALNFPKSKFAVSSAALVADTYVLSGDWQSLHQFAEDLRSSPGWAGQTFLAKLASMDSDASYKRAERSFAAKDYRKAAVEAEEHLSRHGNSKEGLLLAGHASLAAGEIEAARHHYSRIILGHPGTEQARAALIGRAALHDSEHDYDSASDDYRKLVAAPDFDTKLSERALRSAWLSGDLVALKSFLGKLCGGGRTERCERYEALIAVEQSARKGALGLSSTMEAFSKARSGFASSKAIWAAVALQGRRHLGFRDRNLAIQLLGKGWENADADTRLYLTRLVIRSMPDALQSGRKSLPGVAPLRAHESYVVARMDKMREFENAAVVAAKFPLAQVQAVALEELAQSYLDFGTKCGTLGPALASFSEQAKRKAEELQGKVADIKLPGAGGIHLGLWDTAGRKDSKGAIGSRWRDALAGHRWALASDLAVRAKQDERVPETDRALMMGITLAAMGAHAEAQAILGQQLAHLK